MNSSNRGVGFLLILIGIILILNNFGYLGWHFWLQVLRLWPLLLIAVGIGMLLRSSTVTWLMISVILIGIAVWIYYGGGNINYFRYHLHFMPWFINF